jgi:hypothetical protein
MNRQPLTKEQIARVRQLVDEAGGTVMLDLQTACAMVRNEEGKMNRNNNDRIGRAYGLFYRLPGGIERHWNYNALNSITIAQQEANRVNKTHKGGAQVYPRKLTTSDHEVMDAKHKQYASKQESQAA